METLPTQNDDKTTKSTNSKPIQIHLDLSRVKENLAAIIAGLVAGALAAVLVLVFFHNSVSVNSGQQVVLQESAAIIDVAKSVGPSVVNISTTGTTTDIFGFRQTLSGAGSGIIISADGLILTNKHVISGNVKQITVTTASRQEFKNAQVVGEDPLNDIAFIKVDAHGLTAAKLGDSDHLVVGQRVAAIGNALGQFPNTVTYGIISGLGRPIVAGGASEQEQLTGLIQTDAAINPGNSGGPLVDLEGEVVGINTAIAGNAQSIGFAIPINQAKADITSIQNSGKLAKAYLGVRYAELSPALAKQYNLTETSGAYVIGNGNSPAVIPGGPADQAGVKANDVISKVDGAAINAETSLSTLIGQHQPGDSVELTIVRKNQTITIRVTLGTLPAS